MILGEVVSKASIQYEQAAGLLIEEALLCAIYPHHGNPKPKPSTLNPKSYP